MPYIKKPSFFKKKVRDQFEGYHSHKYLSINIYEEYMNNRQHLPIPPEYCGQTMQEAYMTMNIMFDEPDFFITEVLIPAKERFFIDEARGNSSARSTRD